MKLDKLTSKYFRRSTIAEIDSITVCGGGNDMAIRLNTEDAYYIMQMTVEEVEQLHQQIGRWLTHTGTPAGQKTI